MDGARNIAQLHKMGTFPTTKMGTFPTTQSGTFPTTQSGTFPTTQDGGSPYYKTAFSKRYKKTAVSKRYKKTAVSKRYKNDSFQKVQKRQLPKGTKTTVSRKVPTRQFPRVDGYLRVKLSHNQGRTIT